MQTSDFAGSLVPTMPALPQLPPIRTPGPRGNIDEPFDDFSGPQAGGGVASSGRFFNVELTPSGEAQISADTPGDVHDDRNGAALAITDLNTPFTLAADTQAWIEVAVDSSLLVTGVTFKTGTAFPGSVEVTGSPAVQTKYNISVGYVSAGRNPRSPGFDFTLPGSPPTQHHWNQMLNSNQLMLDDCMSGTPILAAFSWTGVPS